MRKSINVTGDYLMDKKLKYLKYVPLYGAIIMMFALFIKATKKELNYYKFMKMFWNIGLISAAIVFSLIFLLIVINNFIVSIPIPIIFLLIIVLGGYLVNFYAFKTVDRNYINLSNLEK